MENFFDKRADVYKEYNGLKIIIPHKICILCLIVLVPSAIVYFYLYNHFTIDFKTLNIFSIIFIYLIGSTLYSLIYQSFFVEKILVNKDFIKITKSFLGFNKTKTYEMKDISNFKLNDNKLTRSKIVSIQKFSFKYKKKIVNFAKNIGFEEAESILKQIKNNQYIPKEKWKSSELDV